MRERREICVIHTSNLVTEWVVIQANEKENTRIRARLDEEKDTYARDLLLCV